MTIRECNDPVARNIVRIIDGQGVKQRVIANRANFTSQAMNDMLNGRRIIKPRDIPLIVEALGVTPNELFEIGSEEKSPRL